MSNVSRCRVCLANQGNLQSLFLKDGGYSPYDKITSFLKINIYLDSNSKFICFTCISELDILVKFVTKLQKADAILKELHTRQEEHRYSKEQSQSPNDVQYNAGSATGAPSVEVFQRRIKNVGSVDLDIQKRSVKNLTTIRVNKQKKQYQKLLPCEECEIQGRCGLHILLKPYFCNICGKKFNKKDNLTVHTKRHSGERDWGCELCGARHYTAGELKAHCRTHAGERPFACNSCPKKFTARTNLRIHQRIHTGERPHECEVCGKRFISRNTLNVHNRIHTGEKPYICAVCGKRFSSNKLTAHARTHTGERPYSCAQCSRAFGSRRALAEHTRTHSRPAIRAHACPLSGCHQRYAHSQSLNKHIRKQHPHLVNNVTKPAVAPT